MRCQDPRVPFIPPNELAFQFHGECIVVVQAHPIGSQHHRDRKVALGKVVRRFEDALVEVALCFKACHVSGGFPEVFHMEFLVLTLSLSPLLPQPVDKRRLLLEPFLKLGESLLLLLHLVSGCGFSSPFLYFFNDASAFLSFPKNPKKILLPDWVMVLLSNQQFLEELAKLFQTSKTKGSVWITMKRYGERQHKKAPKGGVSKPKPTADEPDSTCLVRATNGKDIKLSTIVRAKDVVRFQMNFAMLAKTNMDGLKKRDRKGRRSRKKKHAHA